MSHIVGLGGTPRPGSSTEQALRAVLEAAEARGATTEIFGAAELSFPHYNPGVTPPDAAVNAFLAAVRRADGIVIASPGYHGGVSGLLKNAIDWVEELRTDERPYFDGRPVGLIVVAGGWQATITTLENLRAITHALRGWPTPLGVAINSSAGAPDASLFSVLADQVLSGPSSTSSVPRSHAAG